MSVSAAVSMIEALVNTKIGSALPFSATVTDVGSGTVQIKRLGATTPDSPRYAKLAGWKLAVGDEVICLNFLGAAFVLGRVQRSAPSTVATDGLLTLASLDPSGGSDGQVVTRVAGALALANAPLIGDRLVFDAVSADASVTVSTAATSTFQEAYTRSVTLPAGTWTMKATGLLAMKNSGGNSGALRLQIDGNAGGTRTVALNSSTYQTAVVHATQLGVSGGRSVDVRLEYHGVTGGTTSAQNPALTDIEAIRTA
jgi:hypothetical protein